MDSDYIIVALAFLTSGSSIAQQQFYNNYTPSSTFCGQNAARLGASPEFHHNPRSVHDGDGLHWTDERSDDFDRIPSGGRERLRRLTPIPTLPL
jgi:hypothetical protein